MFRVDHRERERPEQVPRMGDRREQKNAPGEPPAPEGGRSPAQEQHAEQAGDERRREHPRPLPGERFENQEEALVEAPVPCEMGEAESQIGEALSHSGSAGKRCRHQQDDGERGGERSEQAKRAPPRPAQQQGEDGESGQLREPGERGQNRSEGGASAVRRHHPEDEQSDSEDIEVAAPGDFGQGQRVPRPGGEQQRVPPAIPQHEPQSEHEQRLHADERRLEHAGIGREAGECESGELRKRRIDGRQLFVLHPLPDFGQLLAESGERWMVGGFGPGVVPGGEGPPLPDHPVEISGKRGGRENEQSARKERGGQHQTKPATASPRVPQHRDPQQPERKEEQQVEAGVGGESGAARDGESEEPRENHVRGGERRNPEPGQERRVSPLGELRPRQNPGAVPPAEVTLTAYFAVLLLLGGFGWHRYRMVWILSRKWERARKETGRLAALGEPEFVRSPPPVLVQLPVFNERYVLERLLGSVAALDYPRDRLLVQVLDDSTDDTTDIAERLVREHRDGGLAIEHVHRENRAGFKAGALAAGLGLSDAPFVAIFDADFVPQPDFLRRMLPILLADSRIGMVQARWEHLNRRYSLLTGVQAVLLDGHFIAEHGARHADGCWFNFNGTAGIWRREAIADAGGWEGDTLTEDLDLSYRAQLRGWRFVFAPEIEAPAELPVSMNAFKVQQRRWAKGSLQTARKLLPQILASRLPFRIRLEAFFHFAGNLCYLLMAILSLLMLPAMAARASNGLEETALLDLPVFAAATLSVISFYSASAWRLHLLKRNSGRSGLLRALRHIPAALGVGIGLSFSNAVAVLEGIVGRRSPFARTPKYGVSAAGEGWKGKRYRTPAGAVTLFEVVLGLAMLAATGYAIALGMIASAPFYLLFAFGYLYVGTRSLVESLSPGGVR